MNADTLLLFLVFILLIGAVAKAMRLTKEGKNALGAGRKALAQGRDQVKKGRRALALSLPWSVAAIVLGFVLFRLLLSTLASR